MRGGVGAAYVEVAPDGGASAARDESSRARRRASTPRAALLRRGDGDELGRPVENLLPVHRGVLAPGLTQGPLEEAPDRNLARGLERLAFDLPERRRKRREEEPRCRRTAMRRPCPRA